jgi:hypothetical protein
MSHATRLAAIAIILCLISAAGAAIAHSWYPYECCSDRDCQPVFDARRVDGGWESGGRFYPDAITRPSLDGNFHSCATKSRSLCFFVPLGV